jgi:hypothetical protein
MDEHSAAPDPANAMEAHLAVRKAGREAESHASDLADRLDVRFTSTGPL